MFSAGTDATGIFTVTLDAPQTASGITFEEGTVTLMGSDLTLTAPGAVVCATTGIVNTVVAGSAGLTKFGNGELVLKQANTFTGNLTNRAGMLTLENSQAAGSGLIVLNPSSPLFLRGTVDVTLANDISLLASSTIGLIAEAGKTFTLSGVISGSRGFDSTGAGTLVLSGLSPNTFTGPLAISSGTVVVAKDGALGSTANGTTIGTNGALAFDGGVNYLTTEVLTVSGTGVGGAGAIRSLTGDNDFSGSVALAAHASVGVNSGSLLTLVGAVTGGSQNLTKVGAGNLDLISSGNTYFNTFVNEGTLGVWGATADAGTGLVTVSAGARLEGTGNAPGGVNLSGTIAPGASLSPGLFASGNQTWTGGGAYEWEVADFSGDYDFLDVTGGLTVNSSIGSPFTVKVVSLDTFFYDPDDAASFDNTAEIDRVIVSTTGGIIGFDPAKFVINTNDFSNDQGGGRFVILTSGNDLVLRFDPPPVITNCINFTQANDPNQCSATVSYSASATDNQPGVTFGYETNGVPVTFPDVFPLGTTTVDVTATDSVGNTDTCSFDVTVVDAEPPAVITQNITIQLDATGNTNIVPVDVNNGSFDNCGVVSLVSVTPSAFTFCNVGANNVTLTVADAHGNTNTASATVTVNTPVEVPTVVYVDDDYPGTCAAVSFPSNGVAGPYFVGFNAFNTIQAAVDAVAPGGTVNVAPGTYNERVVITKAGLTVQGAGVTSIVTGTLSAPVSGVTPSVFKVAATGVTIHNFKLLVNLAYNHSGVLSSGTCTGVTISSNTIVASGTAAFAYGLRNAIAVNASSSPLPVGFISDSVGYADVSVVGNTIEGTAPASFFRAGIQMDLCGGDIIGNTSTTINHDFITRFASQGDILVSGNTFLGGGANIGSFNPGAGTVTVTNNIFDNNAQPGTPTNITTGASLRLIYYAEVNSVNNNLIVAGNTFQNHRWAISVEDFKNVTFDNNTFTPKAGATDFVHISFNTKIIASTSAGSINMFPVGATLTRNVFNDSGAAGGTALAFYNHRSTDAVFGTYTIGTPGSENEFSGDFAKFIQLDGSSGASSTWIGFGEYAGAPPTPSTTMAPWAINLDAQNNKFDAGSGLKLPSAMTPAELFSTEDKITHKLDNAALGFVRIKADNVYVTTASGSIQRGIDAATATDTVNVGAGTFTESPAVSKSVSLIGPNHGVTPGGVRSAEAMVVGQFDLSSSGVSVSGFEVTGAQKAFRAVGTGPYSNIALRYNYLHDQTGPANSVQVVLYGFGSPTTTLGGAGWDVSYNTIESVQGDNATAIALFNLDNVTITHNWIRHDDLARTGRRGINCDGLQIATVAFNDVDLGYTPVLPFSSAAAPWVVQIGLSDRDATGINIQSNLLGGAFYGVVGLSQRSLNGVVVSENNIANVGDAVAFNSGSAPPVAAAQVQQNLSVAGNNIVAARYGVRIRDLHNPTNHFNNVVIGQNSFAAIPSFTGVYGIYVDPNAVVDDSLVHAENNWWGDASGPAAPLNPGGLGLAATSGVDFSPWLGDGTDTSPAIGFQPNPTPVFYAPASLEFAIQPVGAALGVQLTTQPVVNVLDEVNQLATQFNGLVTVALDSNPGSGVLTGTLTVNAVAGVATFTNLAVTVGGGEGFTLIATAPSPVDSTNSLAFDIGNPSPTLTSLNPAGGVTGSGGGSNNVVLTGGNFVPTSVVLVNDSPVSSAYNTASQLTATLSTTPAGVYSVVVSNPPPVTGPAVSATRYFTVGDQPAVVYVDATYGPGNSGSHSWGYDAFATVQSGINAVTNGGTVNVAAGSFAEDVTVNKPLSLLGANAGQACAGSGDSVLGSGTGTAITIVANDVIVDGFAIYGVTGIDNTGVTGTVIQNNSINAALMGVTMLGISGPFSIQDNCVTLSAKEVGMPVSTNATIGVLFGTIGGVWAQVVSNNVVAGALYGYLLADVDSGVPLTIEGGSISNVMQGVAVINYDLSLTNQRNSTFIVDAVSMSDFAGTSLDLSRNFHAGVYVFTGGADTTATAVGTITNVTILGTGKPQQDSAGVALADFSFGAGTRQTITVVNSVISTNANRGVQVRGANTMASVTGCTLVGNGFDPYVTGGNDGFAVIARNGAQLTVEECFITHPLSVVGARPVTALAAHLGAQLTAFGNAVDNNSCPTGRFGHNDGGSSLINASGNYWGTTSDTAIAGLMTGAVDFTPYLASGSDSDSNPDNGFQGDFSSLHVTTASSQTSSLIAEGIASVTAGGTVNVEAGTYPQSITINKALTLQSSSGPATTAIIGNSQTAITIDANNVTVQGLTVRNPSGKWGIYGQNRSGLLVANNRVVDIGTSDATTSGSNIGIGVASTSANAVNNVTIIGNLVSNLVANASGNKTAQAIVAGFSSGTADITGLVVASNRVVDVFSANRGAYGILLNHTTSPTGGKTVAPVVAFNEIKGLNGYWSHAIGLEGNTPNALVIGNLVSDLVDQKSLLPIPDPDAVGVMVEQNADADSVNIVSNSFNNLLIGVRNKMTGLTVAASGNWWGSDTGPATAANAGGTGVAVTADVDFSPWLADGTDTDLVAIGFQPNTSQLNYTPAGLLFTAEPVGNVGLGVPLSTQPVVTVTNEIGGTALQYNGSVTVAIANNPGGGVLTGTTILPVAGGQAAFTNLAVTLGGGTGYTLAASTTNPVLGATSASFNIDSPAPLLDTIAPTYATAGGAPFTLTANGSNFVPNSKVMWNGSERTTTFVNAGQLTSQIPATDIATAGSASVTVFTPTPGGGTSSPALTFWVMPSGSPTDTFVDTNYAGLPTGTIVTWPYTGGTGTHYIGYDAFATITNGVNAAASTYTVRVAAGTYNEDVNINKTLSVLGAGAGNSIVVGPIGGAIKQTVKFSAPNIVLDGFTVTRAGNNLADWNNPNLNDAGVHIQGLSSGTVQNCFITGNRTGVDINASSGITVRNNIITDNRTGLFMRNQTDNLTVVENKIADNWTVGVLFLAASTSGTPLQQALNCNFSNNDISGNWYGQIEDRQTGGSLPAPGANLKNFSGNWLGTASPTVVTNQAEEPGYATGIPVAFGGTNTPPTSAPTLKGLASANLDYTPWLNVGTDTDVSTGSGTNGFQGDFSTLHVNASSAQVGTTGRIQEGIDLVSGSTVYVHAGTYTEGPQILINKDVSLVGDGTNTTTVFPAGNTTLGGNVPSEAWVYVEPSVTASISGITFDGTGKQIAHAIQSRGSLTLTTCDIKNIKYAAYQGRAVVLFGGSSLIADCTFSNIERIGVHVRGNVMLPNPVASVLNCSYTGKGSATPCLDYGVEVGGGGQATVSNFTATACLGLAYDGSTSAGVLATDYWGTGSTLKLLDSSLAGNTMGVAIGYGPGDASKVLLQGNDLAGNTAAGIQIVGAALVDMGDLLASNLTGLGSSTGGNNLSGYGFDNAAPWAIDATDSTGGQILAYNNDFGASSSEDINSLITDGFDGMGVTSEFSQAGPLTAVAPTNVTVECVGAIPAAATNLASYLAQGGVVSASPVTFTSSDTVAPVGDGTVTRTYTLIDAASRTNVVTQMITVDDITAPQFTTSATNQILVADINAQALIPDLTSQVVATDNCGSVALSQVPLAGTVVGLGSHPVTVWAADQGGNSNSSSATITVIDQTAPALTLPANVTVTTLQDKDPYATGYATANDANGPVAISYSDNRAGLTNCNATGDILRTWTATDASTNVSTGVQTVTVVDTNAPIFTYVPADITVTNDLNQCSAVVNFAPTVVDLGYFEGFENSGWMPGNGTGVEWSGGLAQITNVTTGFNSVPSKTGSAHAMIKATGPFTRLGGFSSVFGSGFRTAMAVYIDLNDPLIVGATPTTGYAWEVTSAASRQNGSHLQDFVFAVAAYGPTGVHVKASNNASNARRNDLATGNNYNITNTGWYIFEWDFRDIGGVLSVDCNVRDAAGTLLWTETRSTPANLIASVVGGNRYLWFTFAGTSGLPIDDVTLERNATLTSDLASGSAFPVGTTTVTNLALDACGNSTNTTFTVTVLDQQAPAIEPISNIVLTNSVGNCTVAVNYAPLSASDNCGLASTNFVPADGSSFPVGVTPVEVVVADIHGNSTTNNFTVTVVDATATGIASSLTPSIYGNAVTFTATVSVCPTIPITGSTITFAEGMTTLGTALLDGANQAAITLTNLTAGTHYITASYAGDVNHVGSASLVLTQIVNQAELTVAGITAQDKIYDGDAVATLNLLGATLIGAVPGDNVTLVTTGAAGAFNDKNIGTDKPVAITGLTITGTASGNYLLTQPSTMADITAAPLVPAITAADKVYDGNADAEITSRSVTGIIGSEDVSLTGGTASFASANAGTWLVTASGFTLAGVDAGNYAIDPTTATTNATILPAALTITANSTNKVYGVNLEFTGTEFAVAGLTNSETVTGVTLVSAGATNAAGVASYPIIPSLAVGSLNTNNYSISYLNGALTVTPADLLVQADNAGRLYGETNPVFTATYSGFVNSETKATSDVVGEPSLTTLADTNSPVGAYDIVAAIGTLASTNYSLILSNGTLTVGQATILVQADNTNRLYGSENPVFTATYSGFLNGDTASVLSGAPALNTDATTNSPVGAYVITNLIGTLSATNYVFALSNGVLTVDATALLVQAIDDSKTYDAIAYIGGNGVTYTGFVNGETNDVLGGTLSYTGDSQGATNAGTYMITPQGLTSANYSLTFSNATLTIDPMAATVAADAKVKTYLANNPALTAVVTGQVAGGDVIDYSLSTTATAASTVGSYDITVTLGSNPNYSVTVTNSTLTVNPATPALNVTSATPIIYGQPLSASFISGSAANPNDSSSVAGAFAFTSPATVPVATAVQAVTFTPTDGLNYTLAGGSVTVSVVDPAIVGQPLSVTQALGGNVSFSVSAVGTPTLHYQWQQNSVNLPGQNSSMLALNSIANSAAGNYRVIVTNVTGAATSSVAVLTITEPPVFTQQPTNLVVNQGGFAQFQVNVNGTSPFTYQWLKNGSPLANGGNILGATTRTLIINPAGASDDASYSAYVTNVDGTNTSATATLTVIVPPAITLQPVSITNDADTTAMFVVSNTGSASVYRWFKNGTNLNDVGNIYGSSTPVLTLSNVFGADRADYSVTISNAAAVVTSSNASLWVIDPIITSHPASLTVNATSNATFTVDYTGTAPTFQWLTNGVPLGGATGQTLALNNVSQSMAADYSVVVSNEFGVVTSSNATLTVIDPPVITVPPASLTVNATSNATFTVGYTGTAPSFQWYKDALPISGETSASLTLANVSQGDAASYSVALSNAAGVVTSPAATLTVIDGPVITGHPQSITNNADTTATFTVVHSGSASVYRWFKNGTNLSDGLNVYGATTATLTLSNVFGFDQGVYSVVVSNSAAVVTSAGATLTVIDPFISAQPVGVTNITGSTVNFSVTTVGTEPMSYQWYQDGVPLFFQTNSSLTINNIAGGDAGAYTVIITNVYGSVTSAPATLVTVPPLIVAQPASLIRNLGQSASFSVAVNGATPFSYQWFKDGTNLVNAVAGETNIILSFASVLASDEGSYRVHVTNPLGDQWSEAATLTVIVPPAITSPPASLTVNATSNATFTVGYTGTAPTFQWFANGSPLSGATNNPLVLTNVSQADALDYTVVLSNAAGMVTSTPPAHLTVIDPPIITSQPTDVVALVGDNVSFSAAASGTLPLAYQWYHGSNSLLSATSPTLNLSSVTTNEAGTYFVTVTNPAGAVTSAMATLSVYTTTVPVMSIVYSNGVAVVGLAGVPTYPYAIHGSTNLLDWVPLQTNTSPFSLIDTNTAQTPYQFYRGAYVP